MSNRTRAALAAYAASAVTLCMLSAATAAPELEVGDRPVSGEFEGRFTGPVGPNGNSIWLDVRSVQTGPTSMITGLPLPPA